MQTSVKNLPSEGGGINLISTAALVAGAGAGYYTHITATELRKDISDIRRIAGEALLESETATAEIKKLKERIETLSSAALQGAAASIKPIINEDLLNEISLTTSTIMAPTESLTRKNADMVSSLETALNSVSARVDNLERIVPSTPVAEKTITSPEKKILNIAKTIETNVKTTPSVSVSSPKDIKMVKL